MRGRKPQPTELKLIHGNPGKRPISKDQFRPAVQAPRCPAHLKGEARKEWRRLSKLLGQILAEVDRSVLSMICTTWARHVEAEKMIAKAAEESGASGLAEKSEKGNVIQSTWVGISNRSIELHARLCVEYGLTPSSRTRVNKNGGLAQPPTVGGQPAKPGWGQFKA